MYLSYGAEEHGLGLGKKQPQTVQRDRELRTKKANSSLTGVVAEEVKEEEVCSRKFCGSGVDGRNRKKAKE